MELYTTWQYTIPCSLMVLLKEAIEHIEWARSMLIGSGLGQNLWAEVIHLDREPSTILYITRLHSAHWKGNWCKTEPKRAVRMGNINMGKGPTCRKTGPKGKRGPLHQVWWWIQGIPCILVLQFFLFCFVYLCLFIIFRSESWHCCFDSLLFDSYRCHTIDS